MEELVKFTLLAQDRSAYLTDRYSERREAGLMADTEARALTAAALSGEWNA